MWDLPEGTRVGSKARARLRSRSDALPPPPPPPGMRKILLAYGLPGSSESDGSAAAYVHLRDAVSKPGDQVLLVTILPVSTLRKVVKDSRDLLEMTAQLAREDEALEELTESALDQLTLLAAELESRGVSRDSRVPFWRTPRLR